MAHLTVAAGETAFRELFATARDNFKFEKLDSGSFGAFTAGYHVQLHLEGGSVDLRADNTVAIEELDIKWDTLDVTFGINLPEICVGGFASFRRLSDARWKFLNGVYSTIILT